MIKLNRGAQPTPSKRKLAFGLALAILIGWLAVLSLARFSPDLEAWQAKLSLPLTQWLSPGKLAPGHRIAGIRCATCHQQAFRAVSDAACSECHAHKAGHLTKDHALHDALPNTRCIDCHSAHEGKSAAFKEVGTRCIACHADQGAGVIAAKVTDFSTTHPPFKLSVMTGGKAPQPVRHDASSRPAEVSGLQFSHAVHLKKDGVSSPEGNTVLACSGCHRLEPDGEHFAAMDMKMTCQQSGCHRIRYVAPINGRVPHGPVQNILNHLRITYAKLIAAEPAKFAKACKKLPTTQDKVGHVLACADMLALEYARDNLFKQDGYDLECRLCHDVIETGHKEVPWKITPPQINRDWQPRAHFSHARHGTMACADCHDKASSETSGDYSFPEIGQCRDCHTDKTGDLIRVRSSCETCHRFHRFKVSGD